MKGELTPRGWGQEHLAGMNKPTSSCHCSSPTTAPSFSSNTQALGPFTAFATGWALGSSNTAKSSRASLPKSRVWGGFF